MEPSGVDRWKAGGAMGNGSAKIGVGIMCKPPRVGISKTRLAADIGAELAAALAGAFLRDVVATVQRLEPLEDVAIYAVFRPREAAAELRAYFPDDVPLVLQEGSDLGAVMLAALDRMFSDCTSGAFVLGSDVPALPVDHLREAVQALRLGGRRAVLGPADDGGYWLIGGADNAAVAGLLDPLPWSTPQVLPATRQRARDLHLSLHELPVCYDVDNRAGLARLIDDLRNDPDLAPHSRAVLAEACLL